MYYLKITTNQDSTKTPVVCNDSISDFFNVNIPNRNDALNLDIEYSNRLTGQSSIVSTEIIRKQDCRIFINRNSEILGGIVTNNILLFSKIKGNIKLESISKTDVRYNKLYELIQTEGKGNHLITTDANETNQKVKRIQFELAMGLNTILFGPPGTGKTYSTIQKSLEILNQHSLNSDKAVRVEENREKFKSLLNKNIFFVTMHPSYSYEDFVQGIKPITKEGNLIFEPKDGIFKEVVKKSKELYEDEGVISEIDIDNKDVLRICFFLSKFNTKTDKKANLFFGDKSPGKVFSKIANKFNLNTNSIKNHRDKFDFLTSEDRKGWKPNNGSNDTLDNSDLWPYDDIYQELKDRTYDEIKSLVDTIYKKSLVVKNRIEDNINFVIILDEINRANISKVFGELITLLEEDKRIDSENELTVTLPSGEVFGVPPNLFVIGTMNTADKSIALVDIALRRRFQFEAMYPKPEIVIEFGKGDDTTKKEKVAFMTALNTRLRKDKGVDFQIGHAYFMKENSLKEVINQNIIPLLTEYYRNDLDKVKKIMKDLGKTTDNNVWESFGLLEYKS